MARKVKKAQPPSVPSVPKDLACGLVMPISATDGCSAEHWAEIKAIVTEAVESITEPRFIVRLVSDADETGVIQKRIVQNVYNSEIVVCDVSGKNPNVMFELGLRLAFDKATVIIKDDKTDYSFDTGIIEHVPYPRDLRFSKIVDFKNALSEKVVATHRASVADPNHSPFLKNFGKFQVAALSQTEVPSEKIVVELLSELQSDMNGLKRRIEDSTPRRAGLLEQRAAAGFARIAGAIAKFRHRNRTKSPGELIGNIEFYKLLEKEVDATKFFVDRARFQEAVDSILRGW